MLVSNRTFRWPLGPRPLSVPTLLPPLASRWVPTARGRCMMARELMVGVEASTRSKRVVTEKNPLLTQPVPPFQGDVCQGNGILAISGKSRLKKYHNHIVIVGERFGARYVHVYSY